MSVPDDPVSNASDPLEPGTVFGRYRIDSKLGEGGMGQVYRAHDTLLRRKVALKILAGNATVDVDNSARFLREARAAAALNHPNIVAVYDVGEVKGAPFIAMELVEGRLLRVCVGDSSVPIERRVRWLVEMADALGAAHESGFVHRDLKPENVIVCDNGSTKLLDFGIAKRANKDAPEAPASERESFRTQVGHVIGTPRYMSPEQRRGDPLDGRSDQYAWGLLAYELLSGVYARGDDSGETPPALNERNAAIPLPVAAAVAKAMASGPELRFASMAEIVRSIEPFAEARSKVLAESSSRPSIGDMPEIGLDTTLMEIRTSSRRERGHGLGRRVGAPGAIGLVAVAVVVAAVAVTAWRFRAPAPTVVQAPPLPVSTSRTSTPITMLPLPHTPVREALAAYAQALQAFRDGAIGAAVDALQHAARLDPTLAPAHLRLAVLLIEGDSRAARESYQRARELRSSLDARDQAFLEAAEPFAGRTPSDGGEWRRRLGALAERYPGDAEILFFLAYAHAQAGELPETRAAAERALVADPQFNAASSILGEALAYLGDPVGASRVYDACIGRTLSATECANEREKLYQQQGDCEAMGELAHRILGATPGAIHANYGLAESMVAHGASAQAVGSVIEQEVASLESQPRRDRYRLQAAFQLAVVAGDFGAAQQAALDLRELVANDQPVRWHSVAADELVSLYTETGRTADAGAVAHEFLGAMEAWTPEARTEDQAVSYDAVPRMLAAERRAGLLTDKAFVAQRAAWVDQWRSKAAPFYQGYVWVHGYAAAVDTEDDARAALDALPGLGGVPAYLPNARLVSVGWVYFMAGRTDDAMPLLRSSAKSCTALRDPIVHVRAQYELGRALEAKGDTDGACNEYALVLDRWGNARPKSVTVEQTRPRATALKCSRR
jgi:serine/threonine protein kinase/tetratricopeptide (TPR) repeat protein